MIRRIQKEIPSSDGAHTLRGIVLVPENPRGILQIVHGMTEHIGRYEAFMQYIAENGFIVCGHDHIGHGRTADSADELGYFAKKDGHRILCEDVVLFGNAVRSDHPDLPLILLGHSMGSFIVRRAVLLHPQACDALIVMGTSGKNPLSLPGLFVARVIRAVRGGKYISKFVLGVAFSSYNQYMESDHPFAWLTRDPKVLEAHDADPFCNFLFTVSAMCDLILLQSLSNRRDWFRNIRKDLPILLISGERDPVGNYGKGVKEVCRRLLAAGAKKVSLKLYPDMRHEILQELDREIVWKDTLDFLLLWQI
ncbi:MAG: alpha/beta hydrolase [Clostridia bacterium]|nr:alpha/beta hydrolase [Clostridia bacterium]